MYDEDGRTHDANDPNYDSIDEDVSLYRSLSWHFVPLNYQ